MKTTMLFRRLASWQLAAVLTLAGGSAFAAPTAFISYNNDSDILGVAQYADPLLVNPWGVTTGVEGSLRVSDNETGVASIYGPLGAIQSGSFGGDTAHSYTIPQAAFTSGTVGSPTGVDVNLFAILNGSNSDDFPITSGTSTGSSRYLYCTEDGVIAGYRDSVNLNSAVIGTDQSTSDPATTAGYTGIALSWADVASGSTTKLSHQLYAANFRQGIIQVFNNSFQLQTLSGTDTFTDPAPPAVPAGAPDGASWSPFNIHRLDFKKGGDTERRLLVVYALHTAALPMNDIPGAGFGYADIYYTNGAFDRRLVGAGGALNSPWGVAVSHKSLGKLAAPLVIFLGNHGDGQINAYSFDPKFPALTGVHLGTMRNDEGNPLAFDGLWALHFGTEKITLAKYLADPADLTEDIKDFYFSAGLLDGTHGLLGRIEIQ
jgi:uncharacterized protein (TIGR03118 family)